ncbi:hypothetical protein [Roseateles sp. BYS87W]|uniref:DUF3298 domain-containing protein n=1 Tax=Pelomonas baiyunensis TaxID=3299026 RepID=A0ABW7H0T5_9BURK
MAVLLWAGGAQVSATEPDLKYKRIEHTIHFAPGQSPYRGMEWSYPVVLPAPTPVLQRLNAWMRQLSLAPFSACDRAVELQVQAMPDSQVLQALEADPAFTACDMLQSAVSPVSALGRYVFVEHHTEWLGQTGPKKGVETLVFDLKLGAPARVEDLFVSGALGVLNDALAERIAKDARRPECSGRRFDWSQVSLQSVDALFITYPYNPREWRQCGDGIEALNGPTVRRLLLKPRDLQPTRRWGWQMP